jgi:cell division protease FtsH
MARKDRADEWIEHGWQSIKRHRGRLLFGLCLTLGFFLIYQLGLLSGQNSALDESSPLSGNKSLEQVHQLVASGQMSGRLSIADGARFRDQYGNWWLIPDFERKVSASEMDFLRAHNVRVDGDARLELVNRSATGSQAAATVFFDAFGKVAIGVFYAAMGLLLFRQMRGSGMFGGAFKRAKASEGASKVTFADVAGAQGPKQEVEEIVQYLKDPSRFTRAGARPPRGVLLYGPPGNGKTLIAKAVAGEAKAHFLEQNASSFMQMFVGVGANRVRELFKEARKNRPCVIFIDEIDSIGGSRAGGSGAAHDERVQTINALLAELDGFENNDGIVVIAATNRLEHLDEALVRPGRFDRKVYVPLPGKADRLSILQTHAKRVPRLSADLERWAERSQGFSGADLANLVNEAAVEAARAGREEVLDEDFSRARDRILMGPRNHGHILTDKERGVIAHHETGHAVLRALVRAGRLEKVSILPRGLALGATVSNYDEERLLLTRKEIEKELLVLMGGRAAEEVFCGQITSGASNDMERASQMSRNAILRYGFDAFGPYVPEDPEMVREIERAAAKWVQNAYKTAVDALSTPTRRAAIEKIVAELLRDDEIEGERVLAILAEMGADAPLEPPSPPAPGALPAPTA